MSDSHRRHRRRRSRRGRARSRPRITVGRVVAVVLLLAVVASLTMTVTPISYVDSGSMAPALTTGDGFVAVPTALAGDPAVGDVVVYRSEEIAAGGLVTHRIVDRTAEGYVTKGDANAVTDQQAGEPPVERDRILAHVATVDGRIVAIPNLGTFVAPVQSLWGSGGTVTASGNPGWLLVALGAAAFSWSRA